ncbi:hypothetical protein ACJX0J_018106, partial [Zea mays]
SKGIPILPSLFKMSSLLVIQRSIKLFSVFPQRSIQTCLCLLVDQNILLFFIYARAILNNNITKRIHESQAHGLYKGEGNAQYQSENPGEQNVLYGCCANMSKSPNEVGIFLPNDSV